MRKVNSRFLSPEPIRAIRTLLATVGVSKLLQFAVTFCRFHIRHVEYSVKMARMKKNSESVTAHWENLLTPDVTSEVLLSRQFCFTLLAEPYFPLFSSAGESGK